MSNSPNWARSKLSVTTIVGSSTNIPSRASKSPAVARGNATAVGAIGVSSPQLMTMTSSSVSEVISVKSKNSSTWPTTRARSPTSRSPLRAKTKMPSDVAASPSPAASWIVNPPKPAKQCRYDTLSYDAFILEAGCVSGALDGRDGRELDHRRPGLAEAGRASAATRDPADRAWWPHSASARRAPGDCEVL